MYPEETRIYYALLIGLIVLLILVIFFVVTITRYHRKKSEFEYKSVRQQFQYLEAEKERIAIDLHDDLGSLLSAIKMKLQCASASTEKLQENIEFAEEQIDRVMDKIRSISRNMMPSVLRRKGIVDACSELLDYVADHSDIEVSFSADEILTSPETEVQLYRITQEILNNIVRHSKATTIYFALRQEGNIISLLINDDGKGFNKKSILNQNKGSGLRNILARAEIIKAKVYLTTRPGSGVEFLIETESLWQPTK